MKYSAKYQQGRAAAVLDTKQLLTALKAAGEATRLRILALLEQGELNVGDLTHILQQSQPRISRHLRLLDEAGLIERFREGSFVYCRLAQKEVAGDLVNQAIRLLDPHDPELASDRKRARCLQKQRVEASQIWFRENAAKWDEIRSLYISDREVEAAMLDLLPLARQHKRFELLFDLGTGTGRVLELLSDRVKEAIGIDSSPSMLDYARSRLSGKGLEHCQVRLGDLGNLSYGSETADLTIMHQVLHFLVEPQVAIREAGRLLRAGGHLLIVDFAPHDLDFLREEFAHERLGFSDPQINGWLKRAGLVPKRTQKLAASEGRGDQKLSVSLWLAQKA
ncbi:MAG: metalloregulator ArsR/SmtB family transcription factor [Hyphomicrobiaceae bacterium]|nr:metalloregulator ArsR/SmtB family transcription factor [Hyphomicrobiaceae bacterium]